MSDLQARTGPSAKNKSERLIWRLWPSSSLLWPSLWDLPVLKFTCKIPGNPASQHALRAETKSL
jgi:hypothetical protein